ncbi:MAG TPA: hypothetical protein VGK67_03940 [Myxococcales bacterium]|jgi:MYXO-CTERM domain-containing protein
MRASHRFLVSFAPLMLALAPGAARGEADLFGVGNGRDSTTTSISGVINWYAPITAAVGTGATSVTIGTASGTGSVGQDDLVLLWQPTGLAVEPAVNVAATALGSEKVGVWEFARVLDADATTITLYAPTLHAYEANRAQVVSVPQFGAVTVAAANVSALAWDGSVGGIVVFLASGQLTLTGSVLADGAGFRPGPVERAAAGPTGCTDDFGTLDTGYARKGEGVSTFNFGTLDHGRGMAAIADAPGGGNCRCAGGGGGGHAAAGGKGGNSFTDGDRGGRGGGIIDDVVPGRLAFGAGGGAGQVNTTGTDGDGTATGGGAGGGVIFIRAQSQTGNGTLSANGVAASNAADGGGGGGGAGGTVVFRAVGGVANFTLRANGGKGGNSNNNCGTGGGGAGGRLFLQAASGNPTRQVNGGGNGTGARNGLAGADGVIVSSVGGTAAYTAGCNTATGIDCGGAKPICDAGTCRACASADCTGGSVCVQAAGDLLLGRCVQCLQSSDCTVDPNRTCDTAQHVCSECVTSADCPAADPTCSPTRTCGACAGDGDCGALHCNLSTGACVACLSNAHCSNPTPTCSGGGCVACTVNGDCTIGSDVVCHNADALDGYCTPCSQTNLALCATTTPACSKTSGTCVVCSGDQGATTDAPCPTTAKPLCSGGLCFQCTPTNLTRCTAAAPACSVSSLACVVCDGDSGTGGDAPCPDTSKPVCSGGQCDQCAPLKTSRCTTAAAPTCVGGVCAACTTNNGPNVDGACPTSARPYCVASGECHECATGNLAKCNSAKPACSTATGFCVPCDSDYNMPGGVAPCPYPTLRACLIGSGSCVQCSASNAGFCNGLPDKPACLADNTCGCASDADCRAGGNDVRLCNTTTHTCFDGCRGTETLCPSGYRCSSTDATPGTCEVIPGVDAGQPDVGQPDVGTADVGQPDVGVADTGTGGDVGVADTGIVEPPDAAIPADAALAEDAAAPADGAVAVDSGIVVPPDAAITPTDGAIAPPKDASTDVPPVYDLGGCGCGSVPGTSLAPWALFGVALLLGAGRRRR